MYLDTSEGCCSASGCVERYAVWGAETARKTAIQARGNRARREHAVERGSDLLHRLAQQAFEPGRGHPVMQHVLQRRHVVGLVTARDQPKHHAVGIEVA